ncbi:hypothetical protein, partial [Klebsiella pneumoniae]|uniref:hypothetical protein n=1 Tax=Klebsiella pneumoniae TaxID=573 RepID=UPI001D0EAC5B
KDKREKTTSARRPANPSQPHGKPCDCSRLMKTNLYMDMIYKVFIFRTKNPKTQKLKVFLFGSFNR